VLRYNADDLKPALSELLQVAPALRRTAGYRYDLTDVTRQVLVNDARRLLPLIRSAYDSKDRATFGKLTTEWLHDMEMEERLLSTNEYFLLGRWLSYVPAWSSSPSDLANIEYDAHSILTTWGDRTASEDLHEYGNRDWAGLIEDYYARRWKMYFDSLDAALASNRQPTAIDWYAFGDNWNRSTKQFPNHPVGDTYAVSSLIAESLGLKHAEAK